MKPNWYCEKLSCWMLKSACDLRKTKAKLKHDRYENVYKNAGCGTCTQTTTRKPMEETPTEKKCKKCGQVKPFSEFHKHSQCKYGIDNRCKSCKQTAHKITRRRNAILEPDIITGKIIFQNQESVVETIPATDPERGPKETTGKPNWAVFPFAEAESVVKVFEHGANKYGAPFTYRKGIPPAELWSAIMRHLIAIQNGNDVDAESGCLHMAHIAANAMMSLSGR